MMFAASFRNTVTPLDAMVYLKILIVEDSQLNRKIYDVATSSNVFEKKFAVNGHEALELYREWQPDIILLDLMMPIISGHTVLRRIREKHKDSATTVVISSSSSHRDDVMECAKLGVQGYLVKPVNVKEVSRTLLKIYGDSHPEKADEVASLMEQL
jgi:CheY-like chemotaxis protein